MAKHARGRFVGSRFGTGRRTSAGAGLSAALMAAAILLHVPPGLSPAMASSPGPEEELGQGAGPIGGAQLDMAGIWIISGGRRLEVTRTGSGYRARFFGGWNAWEDLIDFTFEPSTGAFSAKRPSRPGATSISQLWEGRMVDANRFAATSLNPATRARTDSWEGRREAAPPAPQVAPGAGAPPPAGAAVASGAAGAARSSDELDITGTWTTTGNRRLEVTRSGAGYKARFFGGWNAWEDLIDFTFNPSTGRFSAKRPSGPGATSFNQLWEGRMVDPDRFVATSFNPATRAATDSWEGKRESGGAGAFSGSLPSIPLGFTIFSNNSNTGVSAGPRHPTTFQIDQRMLIRAVTTYHYNGGAGVPFGEIALRGADGAYYGPWRAGAPPGDRFVGRFWFVAPNVQLPAGTYEIVDSSPETWSHNAGSGYCGIAHVKGELPGPIASVH